MHFVKKVPTTQKQKEAEEKKRAAKLRVYSTTRNSIFKKRSQGQLDSEMLVMTSNLLKHTPEITTFWNIRREVLKALSEKEVDRNKEASSAFKNGLLSSELFLTEICLQTNCKSYSAWFHREWVLENMAQPNIDKELKTCERFLEMDGRNFHGWDYRRFLVCLGDREPKQELEFSTRLINGNFSNYSSWHYRSSLLPKVFPNPDDEGMVSDEFVKEELEMVSSAFFVDPEDQSAWVYTEWLLGLHLANNRGPSIKSADATIVTLSFDKDTIGYIVMDRSLTVDCISKIFENSSSAEEPLQFDLISEYGRANSALVFRFRFTSGGGQFMIPSNDGGSTIEKVIDFANTKTYVNGGFLRNVYGGKRLISPRRKEGIEAVAEKCECLLKENMKENDFVGSMNKWPLFIHTLCLIALDEEHHYDAIMSNFEKLKSECDPQRRFMYSDMAANFQINNILRKPSESGISALDEMIANSAENFRLKLSALELRNLNHLVFLSGLITSLDVSDNMITDTRIFAILPRLTHLTLDGNPIASLQELHSLQKLQFLSIARTGIHFFVDVADLLGCMSLERFVFCETPLANDDKECKLLHKKCQELNRTLTLFRHWL